MIFPLRSDWSSRVFRQITPVAILCATVVGCSSGGGSGSTSGGNGGPGSNPNLTEPPASDDEPLVEDSSFNTAIGFTVMREPGARLPEEAIVDISQVEFDAGLPSPVIQVPDSINPSVNQPPFFTGLENLEVFAGDIIEVSYRPEDPEGELPGMFPEELPQGSSFEDNFDGSKTFRWQPLQMDVGISKFTVTAIDPANGQYRASYPILIKVNLPSDPSSIPNVPPTLDMLLEYTVRADDPVVVELKGIDLNGTIPTLEIPDLPAGATFIQDPRFEEVFVLKFTPTQPGVFSLDVLARDSADLSLTATESISVSVLARDEFDRVGPRLRDLADALGVRIGFAALQSFYHQPDGAIYAETAASEFNIVTAENSMKMDYINPEPGRYQFAATDNLIRYAQANGLTVHAHPLIWYRQVPKWVEQSDISAREGHMRDFISRIMGRYSDSISVWDVVNEPIADDGSLRDSVWHQAMGESYIDTAFETARQAAPNATLLINEFDVSVNGPKADGLFALVDRLQSRGVSFDGLGYQMHLFSSFNQFAEVRENFAKAAERNLDIYITELDVSLDGDDTIAEQALVYEEIINLCLEQPRCKSTQMWGFTDQYSFRSVFDPLPFDRAYQAKPAYSALQNALQNAQ